MRSPSSSLDHSSWSVATGTENKLDYTIGVEDLGLYIGVIYEEKEGKKSFNPGKSSSRAAGIIGPILPGPPRLLDFVIGGDLFVGGYAKAEGRYIGGLEGPSEYWWMKVSPDGKRSQITEPRPIPPSSTPHNPDNDPRYYKLTPGGGKTKAFYFRDLIYCSFQMT